MGEGLRVVQERESLPDRMGGEDHGVEGVRRVDVHGVDGVHRVEEQAREADEHAQSCALDLQKRLLPWTFRLSRMTPLEGFRPEGCLE